MSFKKLQEGAKSAALTILENGPATIASFQEAYGARFQKSLQQQHEAYAALLSSSETMTNPDCQDAVYCAQQMTEAVTTQLVTVEQYITWTLPKIDDGGNFGVTVQLAGIKHIQDLNDKIVKNMEELSKYHSTRADALEKCKHLASTNTTKSTSTGQTESTGGKEEGKETKASAEEKTTTSSTRGADADERAKALVAVDCQYWYKAKLQVQTILTGYVAALDFLEKNATKIAEPKGAQGSGSHFTSMY